MIALDEAEAEDRWLLWIVSLLNEISPCALVQQPPPTTVMDSDIAYTAYQQATPPADSSRGGARTSLSDDLDPHAAPGTLNYVKGQTRQSRKIPPWLWLVIAKSLGIKTRPDEKPILSSVIHILTLGSAAGLVFFNGFYEGYDISSIHSPTDLLDGTVSMIMVSLYCGVGVYAHRLAYRLFVHPKFLEKMRLHSKTIMKLNVAIILFLVVASFVLVQNAATVNLAYGFDPTFVPGLANQTDVSDINPCQVIQIPIPICRCFYFFQLLFSFFFLIWNVVVGVCLISVARTHTIDIRRFLVELNYDAHLQDEQFRRNFYTPESYESKDTLKQYIWADHDGIANALNPPPTNIDPIGEGSPESRGLPPRAEQVEPLSATNAVSGTDALQDDLANSNEFNRQNVRLQLSGESIHQSGARFRSGFRRMSQERQGEENTMVPHIMPEQEIMHKYWKLATSTRLTSTAFQRWMCCITSTILFWSGIRVVSWLKTSPDFYDIASFILPLLLLPLLASAYAEVNYEGIKVIQSILPTPERLHMFQYLYGMHIQMTAYGHRISYGTMGTVLAGVMAAFASKILLEEMNDVFK